MALTMANSASAASERVIYSFQGHSDGISPFCNLIDVSGTLYGTTAGGGASNLGTVFSVNPTSGAERVIYAFSGGRQGPVPLAGVINVGGLLYGTTGGSPVSGGSVFAVNPTTGAEKVVHAFQGNQDGANPAAGLLNVGGTVYGTTQQGGTFSVGTVFSVTLATRAETVVYAFQGGSDGKLSNSSLINVGGMLYGTTPYGGITSLNCQAGGGSNGCGTVFSVNPATGAETVIYRFQGGIDGYLPYANLLNVGGTLYGTTYAGGTGGCAGGGLAGCGTVFSVHIATGAERVVYSFKDGSDGANPQAGLIKVGRTLYGTTYYGGNANGNGTVFSVNLTTGAETVVYAFQGYPSDGINPVASLLNVGGTLYGTTSGGGSFSYGTVFAVTP